MKKLSNGYYWIKGKPKFLEENLLLGEHLKDWQIARYLTKYKCFAFGGYAIRTKDVEIDRNKITRPK